MNENLFKYKTTVIRREHFNAAHRLENSAWDSTRNRSIFGKCNNEHFHGHNYELEVMVTGYVDPLTGFVIDAKILSDIINAEVLDRFDHMNLNIDVEEFKDLNPTAENIAYVIFNILRSHINSNHELKIRLYETPRNYVEYPSTNY